MPNDTPPGPGDLQAVTADFSADVTDGTEPFAVTFMDKSTTTSGVVLTQWHWDFGDGSIDTTQNPAPHTYHKGFYNVALTCGDGTFSGSASKSNFIVCHVGKIDLSHVIRTWDDVDASGQNWHHTIYLTTNEFGSDAYFQIDTAFTPPTPPDVPIVENPVDMLVTDTQLINDAVTALTGSVAQISEAMAISQVRQVSKFVAGDTTTQPVYQSDQLVALKDATNTIVNGTAAVKNFITTMQGDVALLKSAISTMQSDIATLKANMSSAGTVLVQIKAKTDKIP